jgi:hypothetical protein
MDKFFVCVGFVFLGFLFFVFLCLLLLGGFVFLVFFRVWVLLCFVFWVWFGFCLVVVVVERFSTSGVFWVLVGLVCEWYLSVIG